jgi:hypothetical protein
MLIGRKLSALALKIGLLLALHPSPGVSASRTLIVLGKSAEQKMFKEEA